MGRPAGTSPSRCSWCGRAEILLHHHRKLGMWLPTWRPHRKRRASRRCRRAGGLEETGIKAELVGERRGDVEDPVQLHRPAGVQLEDIGPGHQHIDLIYFARPRGSVEIHEDYSEDKVGWYGPEEWDEMLVNAEVRGWCERALSALEG